MVRFFLPQNGLPSRAEVINRKPHAVKSAAKPRNPLNLQQQPCDSRDFSLSTRYAPTRFFCVVHPKVKTQIVKGNQYIQTNYHRRPATVSILITPEIM